MLESLPQISKAEAKNCCIKKYCNERDDLLKTCPHLENKRKTRMAKIYQKNWDKHPQLHQDAGILKPPDDFKGDMYDGIGILKLFPDFKDLDTFEKENGLDDYFIGTVLGTSITSDLMVLRVIKRQFDNSQDILDTPAKKEKFIHYWKKKIPTLDDKSSYQLYVNSNKDDKFDTKLLEEVDLRKKVRTPLLSKTLMSPNKNKPKKDSPIPKAIEVSMFSFIPKFFSRLRGRKDDSPIPLPKRYDWQKNLYEKYKDSGWGFGRLAKMVGSPTIYDKISKFSKKNIKVKPSIQKLIEKHSDLFEELLKPEFKRFWKIHKEEAYKLNSNDLTNLTDFFTGKLSIDGGIFKPSWNGMLGSRLPNSVSKSIHLNTEWLGLANPKIEFSTDAWMDPTYSNLEDFFKILKKNRQERDKVLEAKAKEAKKTQTS